MVPDNREHKPEGCLCLARFFLRIQKTTLPSMVNEVLLILLIKEITVKYYFETPDCHDFISGHIIFGS